MRDEILEYEINPTTVRDGFEITDDELAEWALRKIAAAQERIDQVERQAEAEWARIAHFRETRTRNDADTITYFTALLERYHAQRIAEDPSLKTIHLPHGELVSRARQPRIEFELDEFIPWAIDNAPEVVVQPPPTINRAAAKKLEGVENAPGVSVEPQDRSFSIRLGK